jgi:UDP-N-acetylmuramate dehydrogenase
MIIDKESAIPNSINIQSLASFVIKIESKEEIAKADNFAIKTGLPLWIVGEGTNIIPQTYVKAVVAILNFKGIEMKSNQLKVQAGERWDNVVKFAVENNLSGIETLSWIPGKAGAGPIQNIGAYGSEISNCLENIEAYDKTKKEFVTLNKKNCQFGYRDSLFKRHPNLFVITSITLKLSKEKPKMPKYKDAENYFKQKNNSLPNLKEIRETIIEIRKRKLPDHQIVPNAGSYFTNPILEEQNILAVKNKFPQVPIFPSGNKFKIPAGWLIEQTGLKGKKIGKMEISSKNALILTNSNAAGFEEIMKAENFIKEKVFQKFGLVLEREPQILG